MKKMLAAIAIALAASVAAVEEYVSWSALLGAEVDDVRPFSLQVENSVSGDVSGVFVVRIYLRDSDWDVVADSAFQISDGGGGSIFAGADTASVLAATDADGLLEIDIEDAVGASGDSIWIDVQPVGPSVPSGGITVGGWVHLAAFDSL